MTLKTYLWPGCKLFTTWVNEFLSQFSFSHLSVPSIEYSTTYPSISLLPEFREGFHVMTATSLLTQTCGASLGGSGGPGTKCCVY